MRLSGNDRFRLQYGTVRHPTSWVPWTPVEWTSECPVTLDFDFPSAASRVIKEIWRLVPLERLEALYIEECPHLRWDSFWTDVLGHIAHNLSYIYLRATSHLLFKFMRLQNLKHSVSRTVENRSRRRPILFPALSHLVLERMKFSDIITCIQPLDLRDLFIDRVNDCRGLDKLTITECTGIRPCDVRLLREGIADVEWDEYEGSNDDEFDYDSATCSGCRR